MIETGSESNAASQFQPFRRLPRTLALRPWLAPKRLERMSASQREDSVPNRLLGLSGYATKNALSKFAEGVGFLKSRSRFYRDQLLSEEPLVEVIR